MIDDGKVVVPEDFVVEETFQKGSTVAHSCVIRTISSLGIVSSTPRVRNALRAFARSPLAALPLSPGWTPKDIALS